MEVDQSVPDYTNYIKCGIILKSPLQSFPNSIILKCLQCGNVHLVLETFLTHIQEHLKKEFLPLDDSYNESYHDNLRGDEMGDSFIKSNYDDLRGDEIESEGIPLDNISVKVEEVVDPLFPIKNESSEEKKNEKSEINATASQHSDNSDNDFEDYEDDDSHDEFQPIDSESDVDFEEEELNQKKTIIKRKTNVKDETKFNDSNTDEEELNTDSPSKKKVKISPIIEEFMKSKDNVLALIDYYKNQSDLWNKFSIYYRLKDKRKQFFEEISQNLNTKCSLHLTWNQVAEIINYISSKHRDDFKRLQYQNASKKVKKAKKKPGKYEKKTEKKVKRSWFFDNLDFLRSKAVIQLNRLDANLPDLLPEQIIKIIEIYQSFPHLWNTDLIENICSNKRNDALAEMLNDLEAKMNIKISATILEQYLRTIHNYFSKEKRQKIENHSNKNYSQKYKSSNYYENMSFLEEHEGPFSCPECNGLYTKALCFKVHKAQHSGSLPLSCSQCNQEFKSVASYTVHAKRHLEDLQFVCKECNMKFVRHSDLKIHLLTHTDARPYCCEICGASYRQSNSFRKHQRRHENRFSHTCNICFKGYYTKYRYVDHMNSHMNIRSHVCKLCNKGFITSRALKTHAVTHEEARNHACNLCGKTFKLKIGVLQHMRTHGSRVEPLIRK